MTAINLNRRRLFGAAAAGFAALQLASIGVARAVSKIEQVPCAAAVRGPARTARQCRVHRSRLLKPVVTNGW